MTRLDQSGIPWSITRCHIYTTPVVLVGDPLLMEELALQLQDSVESLNCQMAPIIRASIAIGPDHETKRS